ncbi:hypothetical protein CO057_02970 [Candidatus Uhrbacteria bacterium CG_4_9_14_0_2_um_filter_41_50]|uniref:Aspartyl-tRNA amidotransferase n=1 Tax=Candidatus Uhrbacteria bacterium CG_4_9_14_0_2_um_filter_41_50 TaxID=1975031 RepID=A0A2M8ENT4_9BACT|nr:MAG: hypothetical protein COZ45_00820 [Candidatus Uhrbacteria bacterium CG_4_10_14_3_um_filter_41_21]PIZ54816.1 MAG: hypothetical protein COY24_02510 [Candidatus Uhrbacteria bacterium CG_4_10_14_0_2_um_filter_41_21]PJB84603.1 MAG: hypothetical protein CO086_02750 [Candidatus Uhrbacteria bacterium CG_4_9_14_0_8_um_filter_41_16]PJC24405.1 MAG: hypothetical protein CO057_02970 [Candidatus Uhrbacteria bacterium CG_4_9_14_0_2_um_filter_41_50]PJE75160.1 MAG: hypothetical protein COV03_01635 [Candi
MTLYQKIQDDMKTAMKEKNVETLSVLRLLWASLKNKAIDLKKELEDAEVISIIKSDAKKIEDALESFVAGERADLADKAKSELVILKKYLPAEMSDEDLESAVRKVLDELGQGNISGMGQAMGAVMEELRDQVDGKRVKVMIERLLKK